MTGRRGRAARHEPLPPFEHVVDEHGPAVMRVCRAILDQADAEDAWIDTFVSAMRAYPDLPPGSNVRGWLVTIAHNRAVDHVRAARRRPVPTENLPVDRTVAPDHADVGHGHDELHAALGALSPKQRAAVVYRHLGDLAYPEIAQAMGTSEAAARRNVADALATLRTRLGEDHP